MKNIVLLWLLSSLMAYAQNPTDTLVPKDLKEVIVIGKKAKIFEKQSKTLASIDEFLDQSNQVDLIKRGAYAWEPIINNMSTERTLITIDGMRIFGACTDKMDPITSYIEVSNLAEATIQSGQQGSCFGTTIGGSIDLKRNQNQLKNKKWDFGLNTGFETNNKQKIMGTAVSYADSLFYFDTDFMYRNAENYKAGNKNEILFSQFKKINFSGTSGVKFSANKLIEASVIYDKATNVGYPALPMDVSLAEAIITSLKYVVIPENSLLKNWETKLYYNTITHQMDDTKRPSVPIHMDMPGWSDTVGMYSKINGSKNKHHFLLNGTSFYNKSVAEMTMYPSNPNENSMFMYTWPDVRTFYAGFFVEDKIVLNCHSDLKATTSVGVHNNHVANEFGLSSLQIFYPEASGTKTRMLKSLGFHYQYHKNKWEYGFGTGYSERAPSVSEGYGFYLYNSFDGFDHIGNPNLANEKAIEGNAFVGFKKGNFQSKVTASYFQFFDYIIAQPVSGLLPMTIGASGVKVYTAIANATLYTIGLKMDYKISKSILWTTQLGYSKGKDRQNKPLPFIAPFNYNATIHYNKQKITATIGVQGNAVQSDYSAFYKEDRTPDYAVLNAAFGYKFFVNQSKIIVKTGVENILDATYSTYADWNNLPRMGRNVFVNTSIQL